MSDDARTTILVDEVADGVTRLTVHGPRTRGSLTPAAFDDMNTAIAAIDRSTRVVVLAGGDGTFCSGLDLATARDLPDWSVEDMFDLAERAGCMVLGLRGLPQPVVAAVDGPAIGAGLSLALAADIRIATPRARFAAAFVRVGMSGGDCGTSWLLPRLVGLSVATDLLLTGRTIDVDEAERIGLVSRVVEPADLDVTVQEVTTGLAGLGSLAVELTKQVVHANAGPTTLADAIALENRNQTMASRSSTFRDIVGGGP